MKLKLSTLAFSLLAITGTIVGCSDGNDNNGSGGSSSSSSSGGNAGSGGIGGVDTGQVRTPSAVECAKAGGICVDAASCAQANGTIAPTSPGGCQGTECCIPPAAKPNPTTCAEAGGICTGVGSCIEAGYFTTIDAGCTNHDVPCCVPQAQCGPEIVECCTDTARFRPECDNGQFVCATGTLNYVGTCNF